MKNTTSKKSSARGSPATKGNVQHVTGAQADEQGREQDAEGGQAKALPEHSREGVAIGLQPTGEKDENQRHHSDELSAHGIIVRDAARPLGTCEHADDKKQHKGGHGQARGCLAGENPQQKQQRSNKEDVIDADTIKHLGIPAGLGTPALSPCPLQQMASTRSPGFRKQGSTGW